MIYDAKTRTALRLVGLLTLTLFRDAAGQDPSQRLREVYPPEDAAEIQALVDEANRNGIPTTPLYDKAFEGAAKRVPAARVVPALRAYSGQMRRAQELLGGTRESAWVVAGADALRRGVDSDVLGVIGSSAGARTPMALVVVGDLVEAGVPTGRAMELTREALARTAGEDGLLEVPMALRRLVREGAGAGDAADQMLRAMRDGVPLRRIRHRPPAQRDDRPRARPVPQGSDPTRGRLPPL